VDSQNLQARLINKENLQSAENLEGFDALPVKRKKL